MNFTSTRTTMADQPEKIDFSSNKTHYIAKISWKHVGSGDLSVKLTDEPFTVSLEVVSELTRYSLTLSAILRARLVSMENIEYDVEGQDIIIYIPKENFVFNKKKTTIEVPKKSKEK